MLKNIKMQHSLLKNFAASLVGNALDMNLVKKHNEFLVLNFSVFRQLFHFRKVQVDCTLEEYMKLPTSNDFKIV